MIKFYKVSRLKLISVLKISFGQIFDLPETYSTFYY